MSAGPKDLWRNALSVYFPRTESKYRYRVQYKRRAVLEDPALHAVWHLRSAFDNTFAMYTCGIGLVFCNLNYLACNTLCRRVRNWLRTIAEHVVAAFERAVVE